MSYKKISFFLFCLLSLCITENLKAQKNYEDIKSKYANFKENDSTALKYVRENIAIAKAKKDYPKLAEAYESAQYFSTDPITKKKYADSCKIASLKIYNSPEIKNALNNKGNIYYFNLNRYILWGLGAISLLVIMVGGLILLSRKYILKEKMVRIKYAELEKRLQDTTRSSKIIQNAKLQPQNKAIQNPELFAELEQKLNQFEKSKGFTEIGLTLALLAEKLKTNTAYLSQFINDTKGVNFNKYLSTLRINYITQQMYGDPNYLKYSIQGLAEMCGIASRQNFSDLFLEINGLRPTDFIKQRREALKQDTETIPLPTPSA